MQYRVVADGPARFAKAKRADLKQAIAATYADQLAWAGFFRRFIIRFSMRREFRKAEPSPYSLWSRR
jgi:hypothetical protein